MKHETSLQIHPRSGTLHETKNERKKGRIKKTIGEKKINDGDREKMGDRTRVK